MFLPPTFDAMCYLKQPFPKQLDTTIGQEQILMKVNFSP